MCPLALIDLRKWEGLIKKLIQGKDFITDRQFQFVFKHYPDFQEENGILERILATEGFRPAEG